MQPAARSRLLRAVSCTAVLCLFAATLCASAIAAGAASAAPAVWTAAHELTLPANADATDPAAYLASVACGAGGSCATAGNYADASGGVRAMVASQVAGSWSAATELALPANADTPNPDASLNAVACGGAGSCVAVGGYHDDSGHDARAMVAAQTDGSWSAATELDPPGNANAITPDPYLAAVACGAPGACVAVGSYKNTAGDTEPLVASQTNGTWSPATRLTLPADADAAANASLYAVACSAAGACTAVGSYLDDAGRFQAMVASLSGGSWSRAVEVAAPANADASAPNGGLYAVACAAGGSCVATGDYRDAANEFRAMVATQSGGSWSPATELALPSNADPTAPASTLSWVACAADAAACPAGGSYTDGAGGVHPLVAARTGASWSPGTALAAPANADATSPYAYLSTVACGGAASCTTGGSYKDDGGGYQAMVASWVDGSWTRATRLAVPGNADPANPAANVSSMACGGASFCAAAGSYRDAAGGGRALLAASVPQLSVATSGLPGGQVGAPYSAQLTASGGSHTSTWSIASGALPGGLTLDASTGRISGTPTTGGTRSFAVRADDDGPPAQTATVALSITIGATPAADATPGAGTSPVSSTSPSRASVVLEVSRLVASKRAVRVRIACRTAPCSGTITLKRSAKGKVLAKGTYVLRRGGTKSFVLRLTAAGRQAFAHAHRRPVKVRLVVSVKGARPLARTVVVTA